MNSDKYPKSVDRVALQSRKVCVGVGVGVGVGVAVGIGVTVGVGVGVTVGVGVGFDIATPLFHTNFFPLLMHVYFLPLYVDVMPAFEHFVPGVTAATDS